ncbi:hypothetical protein RXV91_00440 [Lactiplantibacillus sp. DA1]|uniref:hypothetical protein n=1 Tax=Lactiplantibacillus sp. DA1 TaxID=3079857 RepID=UPI00292A6741|nr:hypothetical protein [Lactiplantibacillus sp. DA1]MDV0429354.1 hypothetical protein [Lactiplantibacillus sp. DA1]
MGQVTTLFTVQPVLNQLKSGWRGILEVQLNRERTNTLDNETLKDYLANNSQVITIFMEKATDFLNRQNEDRAPARRYNDAEIARQADKMLDDVIANIHDKIVPHTREQTPAAWDQFLSENDVLEDLELSMTELSFESED